MGEAALTAGLLALAMALIRVIEKLIDKRAKRSGTGDPTNKAVLVALHQAARSQKAQLEKIIELLDRHSRATDKLTAAIQELHLEVARESARRGTG